METLHEMTDCCCGGFHLVSDLRSDLRSTSSRRRIAGGIISRDTQFPSLMSVSLEYHGTPGTLASGLTRVRPRPCARTELEDRQTA